MIRLPLILVWMFVGVASAHCHDRPDLTGWLMTLQNQMASPCCDQTEAVRLDDVDWTVDGNCDPPAATGQGPLSQYCVYIDRHWMRVPSGHWFRPRTIMAPQLSGQSTLICVVRKFEQSASAAPFLEP